MEKTKNIILEKNQKLVFINYLEKNQKYNFRKNQNIILEKTKISIYLEKNQKIIFRKKPKLVFINYLGVY